MTTIRSSKKVALLALLAGLFVSVKAAEAHARHHPQSMKQQSTNSQSIYVQPDGQLAARQPLVQNQTIFDWPRTGVVLSRWGQPMPLTTTAAPSQLPSVMDSNLHNMASNNNYFYQKQGSGQSEFEPLVQDGRLQQVSQPRQSQLPFLPTPIRQSESDSDMSTLDPDDQDDDQAVQASPSTASRSMSPNMGKASIQSSNTKHQRFVNQYQPKMQQVASIAQRSSIHSNSVADLQMAAGHHHGHHGHGHYHQYAEVPKKKSWKFGYKRGNHKHTISRHEEGHKNKFHTHVSWKAMEKCKKKKKKSKCKSHGDMSWEYKHHDKKKKHHYG